MKSISITYTYDPQIDVWDNGWKLASAMADARKALGCRGYFFDFGYGEAESCKRSSGRLATLCGFMCQSARDSRRPIRVFRNMNNEIACAVSP